MNRSLPLVVALACTAILEAKTYPEYPARNTADYATRQTINDVVVAIEPMMDKQSEKKYFGFEFTGRGFLPVFVVVDNASSQRSYILKKDEITTEVGGSSSTSIVPATSKAGMTVGVASAAVVSVVGIFVASRMLAGATETRQNVLVKEIRTHTLSAGKRASGFVYVPTDKKDTGERGLRVPVTDLETGDVLVFRFALPAIPKK